MPFTTTLKSIPPFPSSQAKIVNADGTPTREYVTLFSALEDALQRMYSALGETGQAAPILVAALPTAVGKTGVRYTVTNATATTFMSIVAGGGANIVPVVSDGTNWRIG